MYIATGQGQTPGDNILMSTETSCHFCQFAMSFKKISLKSWFYTIFFHDFSPGAELTTPWGWNFDINSNILSLPSFVASLKKNVFEVWFYTIFFIILYMYIGLGQRLTTSWGQNFDVNSNILSLWSFVTSFKKISLKSDFIQFFFSWFNTCI